MSVGDRRLRSRCFVHRHGSQDLTPQYRAGPLSSVAGSLLARGPGLFAGQVKPRDLADHRIAAHADPLGYLTAGEAVCKMGFEQFDSLGGPGRLDGGHSVASKFDLVWILLACRTHLA